VHRIRRLWRVAPYFLGLARRDYRGARGLCTVRRVAHATPHPPPLRASETATWRLSLVTWD